MTGGRCERNNLDSFWHSPWFFLSKRITHGKVVCLIESENSFDVGVGVAMIWQIVEIIFAYSRSGSSNSSCRKWGREARRLNVICWWMRSEHECEKIYPHLWESFFLQARNLHMMNERDSAWECERLSHFSQTSAWSIMKNNRLE